MDVGAAISSMVLLTLFLRVWKPATIWTSAAGKFKAAPQQKQASVIHTHTREAVIRAWLPWFILSVLVFLWGIPGWKKMLDGISVLRFEWPWLHMLTQKMPPVALHPHVEAAIFNLNWLSATGTGIFIASMISGLVMGYRFKQLFVVYWAVSYTHLRAHET